MNREPDYPFGPLASRRAPAAPTSQALAAAADVARRFAADRRLTDVQHAHLVAAADLMTMAASIASGRRVDAR